MSAAARFRTSPAGLVEIAGRDREAFLQGQCTNDLLRLPAEGVMRAAALTPKGKVLADFRVARRDPLRLLVAPGRRTALADHLRKYAVFQDVRVEERGGYSIVEIFDPDAGLPEPAPDRLLRVEYGKAGIEIWPPFFETRASWLVADADLPGIRAQLSRTNPQLPDDAAEALRIEAGRPEYGRDVDESNVPDEAGMDDAISNSKGCYVGQEIVARIRTYGRVNRRLVGWRFSGGPLPPGSILVRPAEPQKEAGRVTSSAVSPRLGPIGLGYALRDVAEGETLGLREDPSRTATVAPLRRGS